MKHFHQEDEAFHPLQNYFCHDLAFNAYWANVLYEEK